MPICQRSHSPAVTKALGSIRSSQRSPQRHKCAACAYEQGLDAGYALGLKEAKHVVETLIGRGVLRAEDATCPGCGSPHLEGSHTCRPS
jgi:transposase-like protein